MKFKEAHSGSKALKNFLSKFPIQWKSDVINYGDTKMRYLFVDNNSTRNIVLIPGFNSNIILYLTFITCVKKFNIYVFELPGYGKSKISDVSIVESMDFYAEKCQRLIKDLKITNLHIIGHSMGGYIASLLSNRLKTKHKLLLVSPVTPFVFNLRNASDAMFLFMTSSEEIKRTRELSYFQTPKKIPLIENLVFQAIAKNNCKKIGFNLALLLLTLSDSYNGNMEKTYKKINVDTWLFWGIQDGIVFYNNSAWLSRCIPKFQQLTSFNNSGHNPMAELPYEFAEKLENLFNDAK